MIGIRNHLVICLVVCLCICVEALSQDGLQVLDNLKRYDSIYESGFAVSGTLKNKWHVISRQADTTVVNNFCLSYD